MVRKARFFGGALLVAGLVTVAAGSVWTGPARATAPNPNCTGGSCTYTCTSGTCMFLVPSTAGSIELTIEGAGGGTGGCATGGAGGAGEEIQVSDPSAAGATQTLTIGTAGGPGGCGGENTTGGTAGSGGGGGAGGIGDPAHSSTSGSGGGGGGDSTVNATYIVAAGGGGGGGGGGGAVGTQGSTGGIGSSGLPTGGDATSGNGNGGGGGGGGGASTGAGGTAGTSNNGGSGGAGGGDMTAGGSVGSALNAGLNGMISIKYSGQAPTTGSATMVAATTATLNGTDPNWTYTGETYYFEYSTNSSFTTGTTTTTTAATPASSAPSAAVTGLAQGTKYYYRIVSAAGGHDPASPPQTFTTLRYPTTGSPPTNVTINSATVSGTDPNYNITGGDTYYFEYGPTASLGSKAPAMPVTATSETVSTTLTNLKPLTEYYYEIVSTAAGPGTVHNFKTFSYSADIHLTGPSHGKLGKKLTYKVIFTNSGTGAIPLPLADVTLKGAKHQQLKILSAPGCSQHGKTLGCRFGKSAAVGNPVTRTFVIKVTGKPGTLTMSGVVVSIGTLTDPSAHSTAKLSTKLTR